MEFVACYHRALENHRSLGRKPEITARGFNREKIWWKSHRKPLVFFWWRVEKFPSWITWNRQEWTGKNYIVRQTANGLRWSAIASEDEIGKEHMACTKSLRKCHIPVSIIVFSVAKIHLNLLPQTLAILPENERDHQVYNSRKKSWSLKSVTTVAANVKIPKA
jgi:hypothetical protein